MGEPFFVSLLFLIRCCSKILDVLLGWLGALFGFFAIIGGRFLGE